jgi:hypothetical protein
VQLRHDIPHTQLAWAVGMDHNHFTRNFYLTEVYRELDIPWAASFYVEDKNVLGTTVRFSVWNIFNGRHTLNRTVYTGYRDRSPIDFIQRNDELVGPLFNLSVKGTF